LTCYICEPDFWSINQLFSKLNKQMTEYERFNEKNPGFF
jgi:hypothetical protein